MLKRARNLRFSLATLCLVAAWLYPHAQGGVPDLQPQVFALVLLVLGSALIGLGRVHAAVWWGLACLAFTLWASPYPYAGAKWAGICGLGLVGLACTLGAKLRATDNRLVYFLLAMVLAASLNALQGLLQWFDLTGELYRWMPVPEQRGIAYGALRQRNLFSTLLCVGLVCLLWLAYLRKLSYSMAWVVAALLTLGVAASGSRTGMLHLVAIAAAGLYWRHVHTRLLTRLMVGPCLLYAAWTLWLPYAARLHGFGFVSSADRATHTGQDARLAIWQDSLQLILERPWFGWGWREYAYARFQTPLENPYPGLLDHAHNVLLQVAVEFGVPAAVALLGVAAYAVLKGRAWKADSPSAVASPQSTHGRQFAWLLLLLVVGIHSQLEYPLWTFGFLFLSGVAAGYLLPPVPARPTRRGLKFFESTCPRLVACALWAAGALAWAQYDRMQALYHLPFTNQLEVKRQHYQQAMQEASGAWLFQGAMDFTTLNHLEIQEANAAGVRQLAERQLHYSPEPATVLPLLQSLWFLGDMDALDKHGSQFCKLFPEYPPLWHRRSETHALIRHLTTNVDPCKP